MLLALMLVVAAPVKVGIFRIAVSGLEPSFEQTAIDALATAAATAPNTQVISKSELDALLGAEKIKDTVGCNDISCLAEIGAAAGVERVIAGSVARVDRTMTVSLQLVNSRYAT